jgi:putative membrane-bound dehydrogenase-like protein
MTASLRPFVRSLLRPSRHFAPLWVAAGCLGAVTALAQPAPAPATTPAAAAPAEKDPAIVTTDLFTLPEGLEITVWAHTPLVRNPTNIDFDERGRLWVAEGVNYRSNAQRQPAGDQILVLEDTDGDGRADRSERFVQEPGFIAPLGVAVLGDKIVVSQTPDLIVFTDVDGDRRFDPAKDRREVLLTGFNGKNHDHSLHSVTAGPDGLWYWNAGNNGALFTDRSGKTFRVGSPYDPRGKEPLFNPTLIAGQRSDDGRVWIGGFMARMNPDGTNVTIIGHNFRNSYEQSITSFGDVFQSDNDDPPACRVSFVLEYGNAGFASLDGQRSWQADRRPGQDVPTAQWRQEDPGSMPPGDVYGGGSPTGVAFYENGALDPKWNGLLLACEAGRNVIFGYLPKSEGAGFRLDRMDFLTSNPMKQFAGSDFVQGKVNRELRTWFRPSDVTVGPDGAIYVADWFDPRVGGHADLDKATSGTIYRIAPKGFRSKVPQFDLATTAGQIEALRSPAVNVRNLGFTRLKAQGEAAVPAVAALLSDSNRFIAARAVWLLAQMGPAGVARVRPLLASKDDAQRLLAFRALRRAGIDILENARRLVTDPSPAVRREVAVVLRDIPAADSVPLLVQLARQYDGQDRTYLEAWGIGCEGKASAVYAALLVDQPGQAEAWTPAFARLAWRLHLPESAPAFRARALASSLSPELRKEAMTALAFTPSTEAVAAMVELATSKEFPDTETANWWLRNRMGNLWEPFDVGGAMEARGLPNPEKAVLTSSIIPEPPAATTPGITVAQVLAISGDAARGKDTVAACYLCHKIGRVGNDFGPNLTVFGRQQPREVIAQAIVNPSADIAHGFDGSRIETHDGVVIDGMILSQRSPIIVRMMGGTTQQIWRKRIKSITRHERSLMFTPEQLGLTPQSVADIIAYLKSDLIER